MFRGDALTLGAVSNAAFEFNKGAELARLLGTKQPLDHLINSGGEEWFNSSKIGRFRLKVWWENQALRVADIMWSAGPIGVLGDTPTAKKLHTADKHWKRGIGLLDNIAALLQPVYAAYGVEADTPTPDSMDLIDSDYLPPVWNFSPHGFEIANQQALFATREEGKPTTGGRYRCSYWSPGTSVALDATTRNRRLAKALVAHLANGQPIAGNMASPIATNGAHGAMTFDAVGATPSRRRF